MTKIKNPFRSPVSTRAKLGLLLIIVILAAVVIAILEATDVTHFFHKQAKSGTIPTTSAGKTSQKQASKSKATGNPESSDKNTGAIQRGAATTDSSAPLTPYGSFVSNHRPNLGGSPAPSQEQSVCTTTPGATCYIQFTQNGVVKKLAAQVANGDGVASWTWDVKTAGFTEGSWTITAIATLNGQSSSAKDSLSLSVQP